MAITKVMLAAAPLFAGLAGGCAGARPHESFPAISHDVADRVGYAIHWHDGSPADKEADAKVNDLLARPLDANSAVQIALLNNRRLQATYEDLGIAQADLVAAGLLRNPVFDAAYRFGDAGAPAKIDFGLTFDFVDLLFLGVRKDLAAAELEATKARVTASVLDLAGDVKTAFFAIQAAEQAVELRRQIADAAGASADFTKRLRDAGNTTALKLASEQALSAEALLALGRAEAEAAAAREMLNGLLGAWGDQTKWTVAGRMADPSAAEPDVGGIEKQAIASSLDLRVGRAKIASAVRALGVAQPLGVLSQLETGISTEREGGTWYTGPSIALPIPLFSQGQPAAVKAAAEVRQGEANLYATAVEVRSAARAAFARVTMLRRQVESTRQTLMPLRESIVQQTQLQYNAMQVGAFELLAAKRDQINSAASYLTLLRDYWTAKAQLDLILNGRVPRAAALGNSSDFMLAGDASGH
ncbi:MAG: transporter [Phycisphaerales bacterium]|nr:transporter [Phycisphaerales bacterium]